MHPPSDDDDDDCFSVQLEGSEMSPRAPQTILRQRFAMRRYHLGQDGRLTNLAKAMDLPVDDCTNHTAAPGSIADTITHSIAAILQPHTSSPSVLVIARAMANLMATNLSGNDLDPVLSAHLDSLAISPQVKQAIFPALLGIAKFTEAHAQSVVQPQAVIGLLGSNTGVAAVSPDGTHAGYQVHQRPFGSNSGSGYTIWYLSRSISSIQSPPVIPQAKTGHLFVHCNTSTKAYQYWMLGIGGQWESVSKNAQYPLNHDRVLSFRNNGEPSWVTRATTHTSETRREKRARSAAV